MGFTKEDKQKNIAMFALDTAMKYGCKGARISLNINSQNSFSVRNNKLDRLHSATGSSLYIQLYADDRYGSFSTNRIEKDELERFVKAGLEVTRYLERDICRGLPDPNLCYKNDKSTLLQNDQEYDTITAEEKKRIAFKSAAEIYRKDKRLLTVSSEFSDSLDYFYMIDSQGFSGETLQTYYSVNSECAVRGSGDSRPEAWWYEASMFFKDLKTDGVGEMALKRALERLNPKKKKTGKYNLVLENTISSRLLTPIISALNGAAIQQNNSFLKDSVGKKIFSEKMSLIDDAHNPKAMGARYFDGEGIATKPSEIISNGVINNYFINSYYSRKLDIPTTVEGPSVPVLKPSEKIPDIQNIELKDILKICGSGIFVTGFNGGNTNTSTGDFSFGVQGFYFEDGVIIHPVKEMNITGNLIELWNNLIITGTDAKTSSKWLIPTVAFSSVSFSGN